MTRCHADHFAKQPREVIHIVIAQLLGHQTHAVPAFVQPAAGVSYFQLDNALNRRMTGQRAVGFDDAPL
jgi:hypothetical protein